MTLNEYLDAFDSAIHATTLFRVQLESAPDYLVPELRELAAHSDANAGAWLRAALKHHGEPAVCAELANRRKARIEA